MTSSYDCITLELPHSWDDRAFYWNFDEPKMLMQETIIAIQDRCSTQYRRSQGELRVHVPPKCLEHIIILWLERRYPKQNSVIRLKSNIFPTPNFWAGYACATQLGAWVHNIQAVQCISVRMKLRAGLKDRGPGAIFTGGPLWRNAWRHRL